jgi:hypothetical protein
MPREFLSECGHRSSFSVTPCFSWVVGGPSKPTNHFNDFLRGTETVKTVSESPRSFTNTQLRQGVNDNLPTDLGACCYLMPVISSHVAQAVRWRIQLTSYNLSLIGFL